MCGSRLHASVISTRLRRPSPSLSISRNASSTAADRGDRASHGPTSLAANVPPRLSAAVDSAAAAHSAERASNAALVVAEAAVEAAATGGGLPVAHARTKGWPWPLAGDAVDDGIGEGTC